MFGAGTSPMMEGTSSILKAPQEARGRVWVEEILSVSPCDATDVNGDDPHYTPEPPIADAHIKFPN